MTDLNLPDLPKGWPVSVDTETNGLYTDDGARLSVISVGWIPPEIVMDPDPERLRAAVKTGEGVETRAYPFSQGVWVGDGDNPKPGTVHSLFDQPADNPNLGVPEFDALHAWLADKRLVFHNAKFDMHLLRFAPIGWGGAGVEYLGQMFWDTQVCCSVLWPFSFSSSLKPTAARLWGEDETAEAEALKPYLGPRNDPRYDLVPWVILGPYAAKDADLTIRLFYHQLAIMGQWGPWVEPDSKKYLQCRREIAVMKTLYRMERAGVPYDAEGSRQAGEVLSSKVAEIDRALPFKPTSPSATGWFFGKGLKGSKRPGLGLPPYSLTKGGKPQLTAHVLDRLLTDYDPETEAHQVAKLWKMRAKLNHAAISWYTPWAGMVAPDGRLRTCFRQASRGRGTEDGGTASGRFSVERVNLQAIPHDYRLGVEGGWPVPSPRAIIGRAMAELEGWEGWEFDLAQAELRVAAAWANCTPMLDAIQNGRDLHSETAMALFGRTPDDPNWGFYRQLGKRGNFTLCFGAGGDTFGLMVAKETGRILQPQESKRIVEDWNALYPQFRRANAEWDEFVQSKHYVPLASRDGFASGRIRPFRKGEETHKAFNQLVQASLAEYMKEWLVEVQGAMDRFGFGFEPGVGWTGLVLTIHDSLVGLFPKGEVGEEAASKVVSLASEVWQGFFGSEDPLGRVASVPGSADGKRWSSTGG